MPDRRAKSDTTRARTHQNNSSERSGIYPTMIVSDTAVAVVVGINTPVSEQSANTTPDHDRMIQQQHHCSHTSSGTAWLVWACLSAWYHCSPFQVTTVPPSSSYCSAQFKLLFVLLKQATVHHIFVGKQRKNKETTIVGLSLQY